MASLMTRRLLTAFGLVAALSVAPVAALAQDLPDRLGDREFWKLINDVSEPGGYFRSDNFLSNERQYQWVISDLQRITRQGGVYLGVGPEQNFTYIAALRPRLAVIFDIRRQNMIEHLLYKALFELAADRAQFVSLLFCRARPMGLDSTSTITALMDAYGPTPADSALSRRTRTQVKATLARHGFTLSGDDLASLDYVYNAFCEAGTALDYSNGRSMGYGGFGRGMPTYHELMIATDESGTQKSYLATEASFRYLKSLQEKNLIVPVVGDFAGPKAIRAIGNYVRQRRASVTAFYVSNVEQYLFDDPENWRSFYGNVATLPLAANSTFIRSLGGRFRNTGRRASAISDIQELVEAFEAGRVQSYADVIMQSR
jgi:hypothetical protein